MARAGHHLGQCSSPPGCLHWSRASTQDTAPRTYVHSGGRASISTKMCFEPLPAPGAPGAAAGGTHPPMWPVGWGSAPAEGCTLGLGHRRGRGQAHRRREQDACSAQNPRRVCSEGSGAQVGLQGGQKRRPEGGGGVRVSGLGQRGCGGLGCAGLGPCRYYLKPDDHGLDVPTFPSLVLPHFY